MDKLNTNGYHISTDGYISNLTELRAKERAEKLAALATENASCGQVMPAERSILDRVEDDLRRAERESCKANRLRELSDLLRKNPAVARILDLLGEL